jgi:AcrR family transcriptional regulator
MDPESRRDGILNAGIWVFARNGYRNAGVADVIDRAGIARGTFYLHFESKHQLFLAVIEDFQDRLVEALEAADPDLEAVIRAWLGLVATRRDQAIVILREASSIDARFEQAYAELRLSSIELLAAHLIRLQREGWGRRDIEAHVAAHLLLGMLDELVVSYVLKDVQANLDALASTCADVLWNGIRNVPTAS